MRDRPVCFGAVTLNISETIRQNADQVESAAIGRSFALHGRRNGSIVVTDGLGLAILEALQRGQDQFAHLVAGHPALEVKPTPQEAEGIAAAILESWGQVGLFDAEPIAFPKPAGPPGCKIKYVLNFASAYGGLQVETDDEHLEQELEVILASYRAGSKPHALPDTFRCTTNSAGELELFHNTHPIWSRTDRDEARFLILKEAAQSLSGHARVGAVLHGAAVQAPNGGVLIFIGESGSGKSTLSLGLVSRGWRLLADDHIPISMDGASLIAFPTATAVKPGSMELDETRALRKTYGMAHSDRDGVSYLVLPPAVDGGTERPVTAIVQPSYGQELDFKLDQLSPEVTFSACVSSGARPCRINPEIASLAALCSRVPGYSLTFQNSEQSLTACQKLVGG